MFNNAVMARPSNGGIKLYEANKGNAYVWKFMIMLPPPPSVPFEDKRLTLTHKAIANGHAKPITNGCATIIPNGKCPSEPSTITKTTSCSSQPCKQVPDKSADKERRKGGKFKNDHTVLAGVCVDWGHGLGWSYPVPPIGPEISFTADVISSSVFCHTEDYSMSGFDDIDWSAFGDICF